jgi:DNA-binding Xre family transcriptional regulator
MTRKAIAQKSKLAASEKARIQRLRDKFQRERPSLDELIGSGDYEVITQGDYLGLMPALAALKKARQQRKLSLADLAKRSGIDKAALSRLENGLNPNPTFATLDTIARAIGVAIRIVVENPNAATR